MQRREGGTGHRTTALLEIGSGTVLAAFRDRNSASGTAPLCYVNVAVRGSHVGVAVDLHEYDASGSRLLRNWTRFYRSTLDELPAARLLLHRDDFPGGTQALRVSESRLAVQTVGALGAVSVDDEGTMLIANRALLPNSVQELNLVGPDLFWTDWGDVVSLARATPEVTDGEVFYTAAPGHVRSFTTDGETFAWLQAFDQDPDTLRYARVELWTASYGGGRFEDRRRVGDVPAYDVGVVGDGLFVMVEETSPGEDSLVLHRLEDRTRAAWRSSDGRYGNVVYVGATDVLVDVPGAPVRIDPRTLTFE